MYGVILYGIAGLILLAILGLVIFLVCTRPPLNSETFLTSVDLTGPFTVTPQSRTLSVVRTGSTVTLQLEGVIAASSVAAPITATAAVPATDLPPITVNTVVSVQNNSLNTLGVAQVDTLGNITIFADPLFDSFAATGNAGFATFTISYNLLS